MNMLISRLKDDEFTISIVGNELEFKIITTELIGEVKESEWKKLNK